MALKGFKGTKGQFGVTFENIFIRSGKRTPFGSHLGSLSGINPSDLGALASRAALKDSGLEAKQIDQVIFANCIQSAEDSLFLPRHVALKTGCSIQTPASLVQRICGSGFEVIMQGAEQIALNKAFYVLCGGTENMSLAPTAMYGARMGHPLGQPKFVDVLWEGLKDTFCMTTMGETAENLAEKYHLNREEVDKFALNSQKKYAEAILKGRIQKEITPITNGEIPRGAGQKPIRIKLPKKLECVDRDEHPRETTLEKLAVLGSAFKPNGVQTAGNSSGIVDGAAALILCGEGGGNLARVKGVAVAGVEPTLMGIGPVPAIQYLLEMTGLSIEEVAYFDINEAFGAQVLAVNSELKIPEEKLNPNGGAIAVGHPLGASGSRITLGLAHLLKESGQKYAIGGACIGGGQGIAILIENCP